MFADQVMERLPGDAELLGRVADVSVFREERPLDPLLFELRAGFS